MHIYTYILYDIKFIYLATKKASKQATRGPIHAIAFILF